MIKYLIHLGAAVDARGEGVGEDRVTPLHSAAEAGNAGAMIELIQQGADVHARGYYGETPLHLVAKCGNLEVMKALLARGADIHALDEHGDTPLHYAVDGGVVVMKELLARGAHVDPQGANGMEETHLHRAAWQGKVAEIKVLLDADADIEARGDTCGTPLQMASDYGEVAAAETLVAAGAAIEDACDRPENVALFAAVCSGERETVEGLLADGIADIGCQNRQGNTLLHLAARAGHTGLIEVLITAGADVNVANKRGESPIHSATAARAASENSADIIALLVSRGCPVDAVDVDGQTALHLAALHSVPAINALLKADANIEALDAGGDTPLMTASGFGGSEECFKALIAAGANVDVTNERGNTVKSMHMYRENKQGFEKILSDAVKQLADGRGSLDGTR